MAKGLGRKIGVARRGEWGEDTAVDVGGVGAGVADAATFLDASSCGFCARVGRIDDTGWRWWQACVSVRADGGRRGRAWAGVRVIRAVRIVAMRGRADAAEVRGAGVALEAGDAGEVRQQHVERAVRRVCVPSSLVTARALTRCWSVRRKSPTTGPRCGRPAHVVELEVEWSGVGRWRKSVAGAKECRDAGQTWMDGMAGSRAAGRGPPRSS
jgi:hypothetical protein